ncbi:MAG: hypothetical protein V7642_84, partial [Burkholderiales bacterium]
MRHFLRAAAFASVVVVRPALLFVKHEKTTTAEETGREAGLKERDWRELKRKNRLKSATLFRRFIRILVGVRGFE